MSHVSYIEQQLNLVRFSDDKTFAVAKFHGVLDYLFFEKKITLDEHSFFLNRAVSFLNYPEKYAYKAIKDNFDSNGVVVKTL